MDQVPDDHLLRVRQGSRRRSRRRAPRRSESTETAIEYDEHEQEARDRLAAHFATKLRFIHPDQPIQHIRVPFVSLAAERECVESKLEKDFAKFVALPPDEQDPKVKEKLIQGLSEWLERLKIGKEKTTKELAAVDKNVKRIDAKLEFSNKISSVMALYPKI